MNHRLMVILVVGLLILQAPSTAQLSAWWVTARFSPSATEVEGIPVRELRPNWKRASALLEADLPVEARRPGEGLREQGFAFSVNGDFDRQGHLEEALVGVYEADSGELGRFLLIITPEKGRQPKIKALFQSGDDAGFSALTYREGKLRWWFCMQCGDGVSVVAGTNGFDLVDDVHD
jgi:hypothetical protein